MAFAVALKAILTADISGAFQHKTGFTDQVLPIR
jgi:hypothetical protein